MRCSFKLNGNVAPSVCCLAFDKDRSEEGRLSSSLPESVGMSTSRAASCPTTVDVRKAATSTSAFRMASLEELPTTCRFPTPEIS